MSMAYESLQIKYTFKKKELRSHPMYSCNYGVCNARQFPFSTQYFRSTDKTILFKSLVFFVSNFSILLALLHLAGRLQNSQNGRNELVVLVWLTNMTHATNCGDNLKDKTAKMERKIAN